MNAQVKGISLATSAWYMTLRRPVRIFSYTAMATWPPSRGSMGKRLKIPKKRLMTIRMYRRSPIPAWTASVAVWPTPDDRLGPGAVGRRLAGRLGARDLVEALGDPAGREQVADARPPRPTTTRPRSAPVEATAVQGPTGSRPASPRLTPMSPKGPCRRRRRRPASWTVRPLAGVTVSVRSVAVAVDHQGHRPAGVVLDGRR